MASSCNISSCERPAKSKGLCNGHYERLRLTGELRPDEPLGWKPPKPTTCTVDGCTRGVRSKGSVLCDAHYMRQYKRGDLLAEIPIGSKGKEPLSECSVDGCSRTVRSRNSLWCETHYYRVRRNGTPDEGVPIQIHQSGDRSCQVPECNVIITSGYTCSKHAMRIRKHGDPTIVIAPEDRRLPTGPGHHAWTENPTYNAVHLRLRKINGPAKNYSCVDCGEQATHWSYSGDEYEGALPYSADPDQYLPRCVPCHRRHDLAQG